MPNSRDGARVGVGTRRLVDRIPMPRGQHQFSSSPARVGVRSAGRRTLPRGGITDLGAGELAGWVVSSLVTFATFSQARVRDAITSLAEADNLAVFVGAGVSAEAGMPRWPELVERLLTAAAQQISQFNDEQRLDWVERTVRTELPPGAAGIAQSLLGKEQLPQILSHELFRRPGDTKIGKPSDFVPGPTAHAIAALRVACNESPAFRHPMKIFTTNYDELLERAFRDRDDVKNGEVVSVTWPDSNKQVPRSRIKIHHLHGFFRGSRPIGDITLTDSSYFPADERTRMRDKDVIEALGHARCVFLGTSFADPNIISYIWATAEERRRRSSEIDKESYHLAVFCHHSSDPPEIQRVREDIARKRLAEAFTDVIFLDHYADVSQFVYDIRNRIVEKAYVPHDMRARNVLRPILKNVIRPTQRRRFDKAQPALSGKLQSILKKAVTEIDRLSASELRNEPLALALWLLNDEGQVLTPWVTTDRMHQDPRLLHSVEVVPGNRWLAVQAVCEGKWLDDPGDEYDSRWEYIVGFPFLVDDGLRGRVCIGALTMTTLENPDKTWLRRLGPEAKRTLEKKVNDEVSRWLAQVPRGKPSRR